MNLTCVALLTLAILAAPPTNPGDQPKAKENDVGKKVESKLSAFSRDPALKKLVRQIKLDSRNISARQINLFHREFVSRCVLTLPDGYLVQYDGLLNTEIGHRRGQRVHGSIGNPLSWSVHKDLVLFTIRLSSVRSDKTVVSCQIDGDELFVNIDFVDDDRGTDEKLLELKGKSVRDVLRPLKAMKAK